MSLMAHLFLGHFFEQSPMALALFVSSGTPASQDAGLQL
jgi:hypothetical protein